MPRDSKVKVEVRGYWRRSPKGKLHRVGGYGRAMAAAPADRDLVPTVGIGTQAREAPPAPAILPKGQAWVEVRFLLRWRDDQGRKRSQYIRAADGRAAIAERAGA